jgi:hypothetical protein
MDRIRARQEWDSGQGPEWDWAPGSGPGAPKTAPAEAASWGDVLGPVMGKVGLPATIRGHEVDLRVAVPLALKHDPSPIGREPRPIVPGDGGQRPPSLAVGADPVDPAVRTEEDLLSVRRPRRPGVDPSARDDEPATGPIRVDHFDRALDRALCEEGHLRPARRPGRARVGTAFWLAQEGRLVPPVGSHHVQARLTQVGSVHVHDPLPIGRP